jgi:hypothetical protein
MKKMDKFESINKKMLMKCQKATGKAIEEYKSKSICPTSYMKSVCRSKMQNFPVPK